MSEEVAAPAEAVSPITFREQFFKRTTIDLSGLPTALKVEMRRQLNRGPTPHEVALVKHKWAGKKAAR